VDRAHAEIRQKEKMLGIGQLVAGIAHQIANPLDGVQNCLQRIGEGVKDDAHLTEYVQLMTEALERIERTAKRVQAFARPRGITLQGTDVNQAVEATLEVLGGSHAHNIRIQKELGPVYVAGSAVQPVHQRPERHAQGRHAELAHVCPGQQG
jgi:nitrogen-specific signal transduction histidine kinase